MLAILGNTLGALIPWLGRSRPNCYTMCAWWAWAENKPIRSSHLAANRLKWTLCAVCSSKLVSRIAGVTPASTKQQGNYHKSVQVLLIWYKAKTNECWWLSPVNNHHRQSATSTNFRESTASPPQKLREQPLTLLPLFRRHWITVTCFWKTSNSR